VDVYTQEGGHAQAVAPPIVLLDRTPPQVSVSVLNAGGYLVPGDLARFTIHATDNGRLRWIGYKLGAVADSQAVSASTSDWTVERAIPAGTTGSIALEVFAQDAGQQRATAVSQSFNVVNAIRRATRSSISTADIRDVAYDAKREALYLSQPTIPRVAVLSLATMTFGTPIAAPSVTAGLDLTLSGDSLLVSLRRAAQMGVVDLNQSTRAMNTISLAVGTFLNPGPDNLRVLSNGKAIITLTFDGSGYGGQVMEYDLATGVGKLRGDVGYSGAVTERVPLARSVDRKRMMLLIDDSCCPEEGRTYDATTDKFSGGVGTVSTYFPSVSADSAGNNYLVGNSAFHNDLSLAARLSPTEYGYGPTTISMDGTIAYLGTDYGYLKLRIADQAVLERVILPAAPSRLLALPNTQTLIAVAEGKVIAVDLH
jgi:hypothetical protein